jgi:hypothetical protein
MPHIHPEDENIVVVQGSWAAGMGEHFNREALEPMEVGTYALLPKKMAHFALSKTQTIIQVHGLGPFTPYYVVPNYELTDRGVLLKTILTEPAQFTATSPPGCFTLKLGTKVRGSYGEGVVIAAQCTPGQLTQYDPALPTLPSCTADGKGQESSLISRDFHTTVERSKEEASCLHDIDLNRRRPTAA